MDAFKNIDDSFSALERLLGVSITLIDNRGVFHDGRGAALFALSRQSHQRNPICKIGFCGKCVEHCRYEMIQKAEENAERYFPHRCWKGAMEVVAPLRQGEMLLGLLYVGIWRAPGRSLPDNHSLLPDAAAKAYASLTEFDKSQADAIGSALGVFSRGVVSALEGVLLRDGNLQSRKSLIREFVFKRASGTPSLPELAKKLHLSPSRTSHLVKELCGKSLEELVMEERMNRAKNLLRATDLSIGQIADIAGFPDQFSFSKIFKRREGCPPGGFRKARLLDVNA